MIQYGAILAARLAAALAALHPQQPALPPDLERLADQVDRAHHPDGKGKPVVAFTAALSIEQVAADAKERMQAELKARFLEWQQPGRERSRPLLRVELLGSSRPVVRGRDRSGYWLLVAGQAEDLTEENGKDDYQSVVRDVRIARQLVRLLDPGAVLRSLEKPKPVAQEELVVGRYPPIPCETVTGELTGFPTRTSAVDDRRVQLKVYVARDTSQVRAVDVTPLDAVSAPVPADAERVFLEEQRLTDGVLLPLQITHFIPDQDGKWRVQMKVRIADIHLNPKLTPEEFDRQKH